MMFFVHRIATSDEVVLERSGYILCGQAEFVRRKLKKNQIFLHTLS